MKTVFAKQRVIRGWCIASGALLALCWAVTSCTPPAGGAKNPDGSSKEEPPVGTKAQEGLDALNAKDYAKAKERFTAARAETPKDHRVWFYLGVVEQELGNKGEAVKDYREALKLSPKLIEASINLSALLLETRKQEDAAEAVKVIDDALKYAPNSPELNGNYKVALAESGDPSGALTSYAKLVAKSPDDYRVRYDYANALVKAEQGDKAIAELELVAKSDDPKLLTAAGNLYTQLAAYKECVGIFDKVVQKSPGPEPLVRRANCKKGMRDYKGEKADYEEALKLDEKFAAAHLGLGNNLYFVEKKNTEALAALEKAKELGAGTAVATEADKTIALANTAKPAGKTAAKPAAKPKK